MNWLHYLVEANIYLSVFYLFYCVFLVKETHYTLNRSYLLASTVIAFILPLIQVGILKPVVAVAQRAAVLPGNVIYAAVVNPIPAAAQEPAFTLQDATFYAYLGGAVIVFVLLGMKLYKLFRLGSAQQKENLNGYKLINLEGSNTAFSFFNYLFIGDAAPGRGVIIRHELVHIRQKHSADIILIELLKIVNWFNPFIYLLQNSLKTIHEYIADELTAADEQDKLSYSTFLVNNAYGVSGLPVTHSFFNYNLLKKRIMMLHQERSGKLARLKYLMAIPLCMALLAASTLSFSKSYGWITVLPAKAPPAPTRIITAPETTVSQPVSYGIQPTFNDARLNAITNLLRAKGYTMTFKRLAGTDGSPLLAIELKTQPQLNWRGSASATFRINELVKMGYMIQVGANQDAKQVFVHSVNAKTLMQSVKFPPPFVLKDSYAGLMHYFQTRAAYPKDALDKGISASVMVKLNLDANQRIADPQIVKSGGAGFDAEVLRILNTYNDPVADKPGSYTLWIRFNANNTAIDQVRLPAPIAKLGTYAGQIAVTGKLENRTITPPPPPMAPQQVKFPKPHIVDQVRFPPPVIKRVDAIDTASAKEFAKLYDRLGKTIRYPAAARDNGVQGKVFLTFTVDQDHNIQTVSVLRAPSDDLANEAVRALRACPAVMATKTGVNYTIPVDFVINGYKGLTPPPVAKLSATGDKIIRSNTGIMLNEVVVVSYLPAEK